MAKLLAPCLSLDATGLIGGFILYSHKYNKNVGSLYKLVRDRKTYPRLVFRAEWGICTSRWRSASTVMKQYFTDIGRVSNLAGAQYHMKDYYNLIKYNMTGYAVTNVSRVGV